MNAPLVTTYSTPEWKSTMPLVEIGKKAPAFTLADQDGEKHRLSQYAGKPVVLYFYPKDDTSGCTKEACGFRDEKKKYDKAGAVVLGVSPQDVKSKAKFAAKLGLNFPILADAPGDDGVPPVCEKYGVWRRACDLSHRPGREGRAALGQGEGGHPRRGGSGGSQGTPRRGEMTLEGLAWVYARW